MSNNNGYSMPQPNYNQGPPPNRGQSPQNMNNRGPPQQNMNMNNRGPPQQNMNMNNRGPPQQNMNMSNRGPPPQNMNMGPPPQNMNRPISPRPGPGGSSEYLTPNNYNPQSARQNSTYSTNSGSINFNDSSVQLLPGNGSNPNISMNPGYQPTSGGPSPMMQRPPSPMGQRPPSPNPNNPNSRYKKVQLYKGNYIVNCPVPDGVLRKGVFGRDIEEFGYLR